MEGSQQGSLSTGTQDAGPSSSAASNPPGEGKSKEPAVKVVNPREEDDDDDDDLSESGSDSSLSSSISVTDALFISSTISRDDTASKKAKERAMLAQLTDQFNSEGIDNIVRTGVLSILLI
jgi:hypothetical protein